MANLYQFKPMLGPAEEYPVGSVEWAERMSNRLQISAQSVSRSTAHSLRKNLKAIWKAKPRPWNIWPEGKPFGTPEDYCQAVTGHTWENLIRIVSELTGDEDLDPHKMLAENAREQVEHKGRGRPSVENPANGRVKLDGQGSNNAQRILRRLARSHPDILDRYESGEFPSVRAAAREAGLVKDEPPFKQAAKLLKKLLPKLTPTEKRKLKEMLE